MNELPKTVLDYLVSTRTLIWGTGIDHRMEFLRQVYSSERMMRLAWMGYCEYAGRHEVVE
jgi:hypothetical protein